MAASRSSDRVEIPRGLLVLLSLVAAMLTGCVSGDAPSEGRFVVAGDGVRLFYRTEGSGPPIVVIHGGPGMDHGSVANDLTPLSRAHQLIYYDQRGGGLSTLPDDARLLGIEHHVEDLEALRRQLGLDRMVLLGHSFGPAIAALYAVAYPEHVERMIFLGPIPPRKATFFEDFGSEIARRLTPEKRARLEELNAAFASSEDVTAVCREFWEIAIPPRLASSLPASVVKSDLCTAPPEAIRFGMLKTNQATFTSLGDWDWTDRLAGVKAPTLIIHGEEDAIPMALVREWSVAMPDARLLRIPATGHMPHAERPEIVFSAIEEFLAGRWPVNSAEER